MPSEGVKGAQEYINQWQIIAQEYGAKFNVINNQIRSVEEQDKIRTSNILVISGGNTFNLLDNIRKSGLEISIRQFLDKPDFVLSGFSAGALVLTPNIKICNLPNFDNNMIELKDLEALNIVDFEIFPHFNKDIHKEMLRDYRRATDNRVCEITDEDYINVDL